MAEDSVSEFLTRVVEDSGAAFAGVSTSIGIRLGLYQAMAGAGPITAEQLADRTGLVERYVVEWLAAQVAGRYVDFDPESTSYILPEAHAAVLADPTSPAYAAGWFTMLKSLYATEDALVDAFQTGSGVGWQDHGPELFEGVAAFYRPGYVASLISEWLPALPGVVEKLRDGVSVADVGCGFGHSTVLMAQAFPLSSFVGYDFHEPSIVNARKYADGVLNLRFQKASAQDFPGPSYDLITFFDCLHDLGDPVGALRQVARTLADDGVCMVVEPNVSANVLENRNPIGRAFTATSVSLCLPAALAQNGPHALGNHAGEEKLREIAAEAGLTGWKLAVETPTNRIYAITR
ncbi:class I SAM-dependent methyltransferase [Kibdelosporangium philippinense]|uniref:Class I SAM-dependent methyltransferase n=1 Tax=Kibdelosporangium philippinense TaxID=211113 RepID=A0ABS8ZRB0_9PSEU|nr:class I SAM-dependent methyltransferase [Kibdelosporangium philippinense]MCE7010294.1 class I SAM-dependent methyltransferase [Kibdelosporangium philippinense]